MKSRSWIILSIGFGILNLLILLLGVGGIRRTNQMWEQMVISYRDYVESEELLREVPSDLHLAGLLVRDYLLDPSYMSAPIYRQQLIEKQTSIERRLAALSAKAGVGQEAELNKLRAEVQTYVHSLDPLLAWTPSEKAALSFSFIRQNVIPKRDTVVGLAKELSRFNIENLKEGQEKLDRSRRDLESFLVRMLALAILLGMVVAVVSMSRVIMLERRSLRERQRAEQAEQEQRRLSRKLVEAQEEERKSLSLELHDEIGQMLSAVGMELGNLDGMRNGSHEKFRERLEEIKRLNIDTVRAVRNLAMGLRPAILDELGLGPALRWQAREFSRRSGVPADVRIDGDVDGLPEPYRTCVYRVVQEALTNCSRHAHARSVRILVQGRPHAVNLTVQDDGVGFSPELATGRGLGLIGMKERVRELEGKIRVRSEPGKGAAVEIEVPVRPLVAAGR